MYVRVEVSGRRQFVKISDVDSLTFHQFVKNGKKMISVVCFI